MTGDHIYVQNSHGCFGVLPKLAIDPHTRDGTEEDVNFSSDSSLET